MAKIIEYLTDKHTVVNLGRVKDWLRAIHIVHEEIGADLNSVSYSAGDGLTYSFLLVTGSAAFENSERLLRRLEREGMIRGATA